MAARGWLVLLGFVIATAGCELTGYPRQQKVSLSELEVFVCTSQNAVIPMYEDRPPRPTVSTPVVTTSTGKTDHTATAVVGIVGALLRAVDGEPRQKSTDDNITVSSLTQELNGLDVRSELTQAARAELTKASAMKVEVQPAVIAKNCWEAVTTLVHDRSISRAVLFLNVSYSQQGGGPRMRLTTYAHIFSRTTAPDTPVDAAHAIYNKDFLYNFSHSPRQDVRVTFSSAAHTLFVKVAAALN